MESSILFYIGTLNARKHRRLCILILFTLYSLFFIIVKFLIFITYIQIISFSLRFISTFTISCFLSNHGYIYPEFLSLTPFS